MDRAPSVEAVPGSCHRSSAPAGRSRCAYRRPLKAASFRTWPGSRACIARDPAIDASTDVLARKACTPRAGIQPR